MSVAIAVLPLAVGRAIFPDPETRDIALSATITTIGYGHLLGSVFSGRRGKRSRIQNPLRIGFAIVNIAVLIATYSELVRALPLLVVPMLVLSVWHAAENDREIGIAIAENRAMGRLSRNPMDHLADVGCALGVGAAAFFALSIRESYSYQSEEWSRLLSVSFVDVFVFATGYHLALFALFVLYGATQLQSQGFWIDARRKRSRLALLHLVPVGFAVCLALCPGEMARGIREFLFSPGLYLGWSVLHVIHTVARRESTQFMVISAKVGASDLDEIRPIRMRST